MTRDRINLVERHPPYAPEGAAGFTPGVLTPGSTPPKERVGVGLSDGSFPEVKKPGLSPLRTGAPAPSPFPPLWVSGFSLSLIPIFGVNGLQITQRGVALD